MIRAIYTLHKHLMFPATLHFHFLTGTEKSVSVCVCVCVMLFNMEASYFNVQIK